MVINSSSFFCNRCGIGQKTDTGRCSVCAKTADRDYKLEVMFITRIFKLDASKRGILYNLVRRLIWT